LIASALDPARVIVRVSSVHNADHGSDVEALRQTAYGTLMLAKTESLEQVEALSDWRVLALCETPLGVLNSAAIVTASNAVGLMWGAEDLIAAMNGRSSRTNGGAYREVARHARSSVLLAAAAYGRVAVDSVYLDIGDLDGLAAESDDAAASGFGAKACIHPSQAAVVRASFRPDDSQVELAHRIVAAASQGGVTTVDGRMIDAPLLRQAQATLTAAGLQL
jgi:citrate lyase subunit beta/citryl-CoA lyase